MKTMTKISVALLSVVALLAACAKPQPKTFTIGIVNFSPALDVVFDGFKAGMAKAGYVEGENVTYIYEGAVANIADLDPAIQNLLAADVDLIFSLATPATLEAKRAVEGTDIPVVFAPVNDPVASRVMESLTQPGGNLTGIRVGGGIAKGLDWLLAIVPGTTRLFVPHNPEDSGSVQGLAELSEAAATLDIELVISELRTPEEFDAAMNAIPEDVQAIFMLPAGFFSARATQFTEAAITHNLPAISVAPLCKAGVLMSYGLDYYRVGEQASRLAAQILRGTAPGDLPVETCDFFLGINLQTAQAIGLDIPDDILQQADEIIR
jgi:putative ABC transport system substrate-binding protein